LDEDWSNMERGIKIRKESTSSLAAKRPDLVKYFDADQNGFTSSMVSSVSSDVVWWKCEVGHSFKRSAGGMGRSSLCPICTNHYAHPGYNLAILHPHLESELDRNKHPDINLAAFLPSSNVKLFWTCEHGHSFQQQIINRVNQHGCTVCNRRTVIPETSLLAVYPDIAAQLDPLASGFNSSEVSPHSSRIGHWICSKFPSHQWAAKIEQRTRLLSGCPHCDVKTSKPELRLYAEIKALFPDTQNRKKFGKTELDIFIPSLNIGIEYDGAYWHKNNSAKDLKKIDKFFSLNINVIRVREYPLEITRDLDVQCSSNKEITKVDINNIVQKLMAIIPDSYADVVQDYIDASNFVADADFKHLLTTMLIPSDDSSFEKNFPELAKEFDAEKNTYPITSLSSGSNLLIYWKCAQNPSHRWSSILSSRTSGRGAGCPFCAGKKVDAFNSLAACFPEIAAQLDTDKSGFTADQVVPGSGKVGIWRCNEGHEWQAKIANRTSQNKTGCPYCSGRKKTNDLGLVALFPEIAAQVDRDLYKGDLSRVAPNTKVMLPFVCEVGHKWVANLGNRTRLGRGCPFCAGQRIEAGKSLADLFPELAKEYDLKKNSESPYTVFTRTNKKYWWTCSVGHSYQRKVIDRTNFGRGCPECG
jgi:hypothetical protein